MRRATLGCGTLCCSCFSSDRKRAPGCLWEPILCVACGPRNTKENDEEVEDEEKDNDEEEEDGDDDDEEEEEEERREGGGW